MGQLRKLRLESLETRRLMHGEEVHTAPDANGDGLVNLFDVNVVSDNWEKKSPLGDTNGDGTVDIFDVNAISDAWGQTPHMDSAVKQTEHLALLKLVPKNAADVMAVRSGAWNDPTTWSTGAVPADGAKVWIPEWHSVFMDGDSALLNWVRVDGQLVIGEGVHFQFETLIGTTHASLEVDAIDDTTRLTILDNGPLDFTNDPFAFHRGIIWHGSADLRGEVVEGEVVSRGGVDYQLERSIVIESENPALDRRGHVMFMHNPEVNIDGVLFKNLGRTDKSVVVTDPDGQGNKLENPRGRYPVHIHRAGEEAAQAVVKNSVVWGSPGWGFVNHESNVLFENDLTYQVTGAGFITEIGTERGTFLNNVAIDTPGFPGSIDGDRGNKDFGFTGVGFWMHGSGGVEVHGNKSFGARESGYMFMSDSAGNGRTPIVFRGNESYDSPKSLTVWANNFFAPFDPPAGQVWSEFSGNILYGHVFIAYSSYLDIFDNEFVGTNPNGSIIGHSGVMNNVHFTNNTFRNAKVGIYAPTEGTDNLIEGNTFENISHADIYVQNTAFDRPRELDINANVHSSATWHVYMGVDFYSYNLEPAYNRSPYDNYAAPNWRPLFDGPDKVHDQWTVGNTAIGSDSHVCLDGVPLYFVEQGADFEFGKLLVDFPDEIRYEPDGVTLATGASLNARGLFVGGAPIGDNQYHLPKVRGVLVGA